MPVALGASVQSIPIQVRAPAELRRSTSVATVSLSADFVPGCSGIMLVYSEFGRRLEENAGAGTDHGTAGPVFVIEPAVRAGIRHIRALPQSSGPRRRRPEICHRLPPGLRNHSGEVVELPRGQRAASDLRAAADSLRSVVRDRRARRFANRGHPCDGSARRGRCSPALDRKETVGNIGKTGTGEGVRNLSPKRPGRGAVLCLSQPSPQAGPVRKTTPAWRKTASGGKRKKRPSCAS